MSHLARCASRRSNACAILNEDEFRKIVEAAELYVSARSTLMSFISTLGNLVQRGMSKIPEDKRDEIIGKIHDAFCWVQSVSVRGMDNDPGRVSSDNLYTTVVVASGAIGGAFGLPSVLVELPLTTGLILRSIADIGRALGERLDDPGFRRTCLEVLAYGSPLDDEEDEIAFVSARIGAVEISEMIARVAVRYLAALAPRIAAGTVPVIGAGLAAAVNWAYMNFYQSMARVLFMLLPIERKYDPAQVRSCFASVVREIREKQASRRTHRDER